MDLHFSGAGDEWKERSRGGAMVTCSEEEVGTPLPPLTQRNAASGSYARPRLQLPCARTSLYSRCAGTSLYSYIAVQMQLPVATLALTTSHDNTSYMASTTALLQLLPLHA